MKAEDILRLIHEENENRAYFTRIVVLDQSARLVKVRLYISATLFIQIYRNDQFNTTSFVLIYNKQRLYARDQLGDLWHRHTVAAPHLHDTSAEGRKGVTLSEFLDEVELVLSAKGLP